MTGSDGAALLTLEPLIDAIREGVEGAGWELSGLQKTTSHQFEGRWEGESTRSAYVFFHAPMGPDYASVDVYLDETSRGLTGNLALVVDLRPLGTLGSVETVLRALAAEASSVLDANQRRPLTLRLRLGDADTDMAEAETEVRFKVRIPRGTIEAGARAVTALARESVASFERLLRSSELSQLAPQEFEDGTP